MAALPALAERNTVLRSLPAADLGATLALLEARRVRLGAVLTSPGEPIAELVFPADAVASMVVDSEDGMSVEVATIGNDGLVGSECFLGLANASHRVIWQVEGFALVGRAVDLVGSDPDSNLARLSRRYFRTVLSQASQGVLCNRLHPLEQRAARWLLLCAIAWTPPRSGSPTSSSRPCSAPTAQACRWRRGFSRRRD